MPFIYNGTTITGSYTVKYGNTSLTKIIYNGQTVWEKITSKTYRYKAKACRYGKTSLQLPTSAGNFTLNSNNNPSVMFCFLDTTDTTGYNTTLSTCMGKTITSMAMYFYRTNVSNYSASTNTCWTYNQQISNGGITAISNRHATYHFDQAPPNPTAVGVQSSGLTTAQLQSVFASGCRYQLTTASGSGVNALTTGYYYAFGFRCMYYPGVAPGFRCDNTNYTDVYVDITANS